MLFLFNILDAQNAAFLGGFTMIEKEGEEK